MTVTAAEFMAWCCRPEHEDRAFELDRGQLVERRTLESDRHGTACALVCRVLGNYLYDQLGRGYALANNVGFHFERNPDTVYCPDLMVYTRNKESPWTNDLARATPDLVVEVLTEHDSPDVHRARAERLHAAGVPLVWLVCSDAMTVTPLEPGRPPRALAGADVLTGFASLPDFRCTVDDLFWMPGQP